MGKFITEKVIPTGSGSGLFDKASLESYLSDIKNNGERILCYSSDMEKGLGCKSCGGDTFSFFTKDNITTIKDKEKGEFIKSMVCVYTLTSNGKTFTCNFIGNSAMQEKEQVVAS